MAQTVLGKAAQAEVCVHRISLTVKGGRNGVAMINNRELDLDDYLAIARRRLKLLLAIALPAAAIGFLVSFCFSPQYSSRSLVLVERQTVPSGYVRPIVTTSLIDRIVTLQQEVLSHTHLEQLVNRLGLAKRGKTVEDEIEDIQRHTSISEADPTGIFRRSTDFVGFYVGFTANNPHDAQQICSEMTSLLLAENLKMREQVAVNTNDFLSRQLGEAKSNLDQKDEEFAEFKSRYLGQLPGDVESNLRILSGLNSQLDANTQSINRAQQDKSYAQSLLDQQLTAWKSSQTIQTSETIGQQLVSLQSQLVTLQVRYTDEYPDVIKLKSDIAALEAKQKEMAVAGADPVVSNKPYGKPEPPELRQLRERIRQNDDIIARATTEEKRLRTLIDSYQSRLTLSPKVEEQYKQLTRDNDVAHNFYNTLLANKSESEIQTDLERSQQGEQLRLLDPANLPDSPSFPVRWKFAAGGFGSGLTLGLTIAFWLELRDKRIRDERDVLAALELPMLTSIPWVNSPEMKTTNGVGGRLKTLLGPKFGPGRAA
jgi:polysaccharide chain length determinant protein (PEP-CTERM system associated)